MSAPPFQPGISRRGLAALLIAAFLALMALPYVLSSYHLGIVVQMMIFALLAMSLDLLVGFTGMASLGHAAYFGIAAYTAGLLALKLSASVWVAIPAALLITALTATVFGLLALRTRGSYFLMITLALSQVAWGIAFGWRTLTGGDDGLPNIPRPSIIPHWPLTGDTAFYYFVLVLAGAGTIVLLRVISSPFGYALRGIRESETRMRALGYNVWRYKLTAFVVAAALAGLAGCLYVYYNRFVSPDYLQVVRSAEVLLMVILGGAGTLVGPAIGAALLVVLQNLISAYTERWLTVLGVIYILVALFAPRGVLGFVSDLVRNLRLTRAKP